MMPSSHDTHASRRARLIAAVLAVATTVSVALPTASAWNNSPPPIDRSESRAAQEELAAARQAYVRLSVARTLADRRSATPTPTPTHSTASQRQQMPSAVRSAERSSSLTPLPSSRFVPQPQRQPEIDPVQTRLEHEVALAIEHYQAVRRPLIEAVHDNADYRAMAAARDDVRRAIDALLMNGHPGDPGVVNLSKKALDIGCKMTRAEMLALATNPNAEDARLTMTATSARLRQYLDVRHVASGMPPRVHPLPAPTPTDHELTAARERIVSANRRLADALMREAAMEQVREMRIAQAQNGRAMSVFGY